MAGIFSTIEISGTGMSVQRQRMNVVAENIANAETTSTERGGPYRRKQLQVSSNAEKLPFKTVMQNSMASLTRTNRNHMSMAPIASGQLETVMKAQAEEIEAGPDSFRLIYDPHHPESDEEGYVKMPDIEIINEMVDMITANRAYEANATTISASKDMLKSALDI